MSSSRTGTEILAAHEGSNAWAAKARISRVTVWAAATRAGQVPP